MDIHIPPVPNGKKIFIASDFHLGAPNEKESLVREKRIVAWLNEIEKDCHALFLIGDIFDFWFEYKYLIPKGFSLFLAKIKGMREKEIPIYFFIGNHDMWMFDYFPSEFGIPIIRKHQSITIADKKVFISHGDGLGPGDHVYKFLKLFFNSPFCQWLFALLPSRIGMGIAINWSRRSRKSQEGAYDAFLENEEWLVQFIKEESKKNPHDLWIFGHRHLAIDYFIEGAGRYLNSGEWISLNSYITIDDKGITELLDFSH